MKPEQEQQLLDAFYDRLFDAVTHAPDGKTAPFPQNIHFQMCKNEVLDPAEFENMLGPTNPNGDQRGAELFAQMVDRLPNPGVLWSDSTQRLSQVVRDTLAQANTKVQTNEEQRAIYDQAFKFLNTTMVSENFKGEKTEQVVPSPIVLAYEEARRAYVDAVTGYRTAYLDYNLDTVEGQRGWNVAAPRLRNLVEKTYNEWNRSGRANVEEAQQALESTINNAVSHAIAEVRRLSDPNARRASVLMTGEPWHLSVAVPSNWASAKIRGAQFRFSSKNIRKNESSRVDSYGVEAEGRYGLFHASGGVEGEHERKTHHMGAEQVTIEAELLTVTILRPWFNPLLLALDGWWVDGLKQGALSNGDVAAPKGIVPLIPTAFVVARNVTIKANFSAEDEKFVRDSVKAKLAVGWGPFSISGSYGHESSSHEFESNIANGELRVPGLQLLAWISTVPPASPPMSGI
jgi:hypothetical protein